MATHPTSAADPIQRKVLEGDVLEKLKHMRDRIDRYVGSTGYIHIHPVMHGWALGQNSELAESRSHVDAVEQEIEIRESIVGARSSSRGSLFMQMNETETHITGKEINERGRGRERESRPACTGCGRCFSLPLKEAQGFWLVRSSYALLFPFGDGNRSEKLYKKPSLAATSSREGARKVQQQTHDRFASDLLLLSRICGTLCRVVRCRVVFRSRGKRQVIYNRQTVLNVDCAACRGEYIQPSLSCHTPTERVSLVLLS